MSLRHKIIQIRTQFPLLLEGSMLTVAGLFLFFMPTEPGIVSNLVAWLETDGSYYAQSAGIVLFLWGLAQIFLFLGRCCNRYAIFSKGKLLLSIEQGVFDNALNTIWADYFHRNDLKVMARFQRSRLEIIGESPEDWSSLDDLIEHISQKLVTLTGYMGPIHITITHKREMPDTQLLHRED
jgi:hypothetical protein